MSADRQDLDTRRTERPEGSALPTVRAVIATEAVRRGVPEVHVGGVALDAAVRWVHVSDSDRVADLLDGGELLLTTAAGWSGSDGDLRALVASLARVGVAGIVVELGSRFRVVPPALVAACREHRIALISLDRVVKFVTVTETVHRMIIAGQVEALEERQRLHTLFTGLTVRGAPADTIVAETSKALHTPVVLEGLDREVVVAATHDLSHAEVLAGWSTRSREDDGVLGVPVEARGVHWGRLVALPGPAHPAGRLTVLQLAATALALARLADGPRSWAALPAQMLIDAIVGGRHLGADDVAVRLESAGLPTSTGMLTLLVAAGAQADAVERAVAALRAAGVHALGAGHEGDGAIVVSSETALPSALLAEIAAGLPGGLAVGIPASSVVDLLVAVRPTRLLAPRLAAREVRHVDDRPLTRLVASLADDHRLQEHSERMLVPLIRHDERGGDLLRVLRAVVAHPANRTAAAAASHLSRSVFYQRLALIGDLLDADLDDGETLSALHLALLASGR